MSTKSIFKQLKKLGCGHLSPKKALADTLSTVKIVGQELGSNNIKFKNKCKQMNAVSRTIVHFIYLEWLDLFSFLSPNFIIRDSNFILLRNN